MLLRGIDGSEFEVTIEGPGPTTKVYGAGGDQYWVEVRARVSTPTQGWTFSGEILDNLEVGILADWLQTISGSRYAAQKLDFAEPDFSFRVLDSSEDYIALRIYFERRGRPGGLDYLGEDWGSFWVDLQVLRADLRAEASALRADASRLPPGDSLKGL